VTGKPLNPFPNLREQEAIIPFFSNLVEQKRQELELKKKKEQEESQAGTLYHPINLSSFEGGGNKEEVEVQPKPKVIKDLHRFEWMKKESWIRCRLRQRGWSYNDMFLNVQCSWTLLRLKMEIKKHLFEGSLLLDNILIYKNDLSIIDKEKDDDEDEDDINEPDPNPSSYTHDNSNGTAVENGSHQGEEEEDKFAAFSKNQECNEPLYKLFPRISNLKSLGDMIPFENGYTRCDDNDYPILVIGQRPLHIYEPPPPPPPTPAKPKVAKKKKDGEGKKKPSKPKTGAKKKKVVKKKKKVEEDIPPPEEIDPNAPHEPDDNEILDMKDEDITIFTEPNQILKNPNQYLYVFFDVNSPFYPSSIK